MSSTPAGTAHPNAASPDPIDAIEYESMLFSRHLSTFPGRSRRTRGTLDQSAYTLLSLLEVSGPMSIGDLAKVTGLDASTLNRQTAALVRDGNAKRIAPPDGGIARRFRLTPAGKAALADERHASRQALHAVIADWSDADRARFATLLERLNRSIEERSGRPWPRAGRDAASTAASTAPTAASTAPTAASTAPTAS